MARRVYYDLPPEQRPRRPSEQRPRDPRRKTRRRRWPRRLLVGANVVLLLCLLAVGGVFAYVKLRFGQINQVAVSGITPVASGAPINVLVVGSDTRSFVSNSRQAQAFGTTSNAAGQRSDVTMVLHIDPAKKTASVLSIPRDLFVPIAGTSQSNRINSAFNDGPSQLTKTIQQDLHIPINHYVAMNFVGFQGIVNAVGGINMYFPYPARDAYSGLNVTSPGCVHLSGSKALALARSRDYQYLANGSWQYDGTGDLGRIQRQHTFLRVLMSAAVQKGIHNPVTANAIVGSAVHDVTIDNQMSVGDIVSLVLDFRSVNPSSIPTYTVPTTPVNNYQNYGDVLFAQQPQTAQVIDEFLGSSGSSKPASPSVSPSSVGVQVLNGSGVSSQAAQAATALRSAGFKVVGTGDASSFSYSETQVLYAPGKKAQGQLVQGEVAGGASLAQGSASQGADVVIVTGANFGGIKASAGAQVSSAPAPSSYPAFDPRAC